MDCDEKMGGPGLASGDPSRSPVDLDFAGVYATYRRAVFWFFRRRGFSTEESEDLSQETFLRVSQELANLRSAEAVRAWLLRIAANVWKNELRRRSADKRAEPPGDPGGRERPGEPPGTNLEPPVEDSPRRRLLAAERLSLARDELRRMGPQMRRCLLLHSVEGRKYREIAVLMQISIQTVKSHIHQARGKLRAAIDGRSDEETR
jgi:RNA polymerase sigma-70 factor, ECF subfamily